MAVDEATVIVMTEVPAPAIGFVAKLTVTPEGWPLAASAIEPLNPPVTALVIVDVPELPCTTETDAGDAERLKPGAGAVPSSPLIRLAPFMLPHPVARSYPTVAE